MHRICLTSTVIKQTHYKRTTTTIAEHIDDESIGESSGTLVRRSQTCYIRKSTTTITSVSVLAVEQPRSRSPEHIFQRTPVQPMMMNPERSCLRPVYLRSGPDCGMQRVVVSQHAPPNSTAFKNVSNIPSAAGSHTSPWPMQVVTLVQDVPTPAHNVAYPPAPSPPSPQSHPSPPSSPSSLSSPPSPSPPYLPQQPISPQKRKIILTKVTTEPPKKVIRNSAEQSARRRYWN